MPKITGVRERRGRARVFVDREFWAELDAGVVLERGLAEGAELSEEELASVRREGERALAMSRALRFLGYRARSKKEVADRLRRYGYGSETTGAVICRLEELGYLDDEEFARVAVREKARRYGPRRISADLRRGGISPEAAERAIDEEFSGRSEVEDARRIVSRRYNRARGSDAEARRVYGFLMRRGYSAEVCAEVAREYRGPSRSSEA